MEGKKVSKATLCQQRLLFLYYAATCADACNIYESLFTDQ
jgi:hypothetical protein